MTHLLKSIISRTEIAGDCAGVQSELLWHASKRTQVLMYMQAIYPWQKDVTRNPFGDLL